MAQNTEYDESIQKINTLIKGIQIAMLTTADPDGTLHSRPMGTQQVEFDGDLWFFTRVDSEKVGDVQKNHHVNVSYAAPDKQRYVSISGKAETVHDKAKEKELWSPLYKIWFPDGLDDPELVLLKVTVEHAEYWESPSNAVIRLAGFAKAVVTGHSDSLGKNEQIDMTSKTGAAH